MHEDIGKPSSIAEMLRWGDLYNNQAYRTIFEASNRARPRNNLNLLWKSNAAWVSFFWQIFDWYLRPNAGYYTMKSALAPLHVQFSHIDKGLQVISTLNEDFPVEVKVSVFGANGTLVGTRTQKTISKLDQTVHLEPIADLVAGDNLYFVAMDLLDTDGKLRDRTVTWTQKDTKWQSLLQIPPADLDLTVKSAANAGNEAVYHVTVSNPGSVPAVNVMLELTDGVFGKEILPAFWSNNALTLMPGETTTVEVKVRKKLLPEGLHVVAEGFNVVPSSWDVANGAKKSMQFRIEDLKIVQGGSHPVLHFSTQQSQDIGTRITSGPVKLMIDNDLLRYVTVAARAGGKLHGRIELTGVKPGPHKIQLGGQALKLP
jgi:exo-1,4-beta-D-glucosaminidase